MAIEATALITDLQNLADELGHPPSIQEYRERGSHSATTYYNRFGSWQEALAAAGLSAQERNSEIADTALLNELHRLAGEFDQRPTATLMNEHGNYWASTYRDHFDSWNTALETAGFDVTQEYTDRPIDMEQLRGAIAELAETIGHPPTTTEMAEKGPYSPRTYFRRYDSWDDALTAAGLTPEDCPSHSNEVTRDALLEELRRLADEVDRPPTMQDMNVEGAHSATTYISYFGSWRSALTTAFD